MNKMKTILIFLMLLSFNVYANQSNSDNSCKIKGENARDIMIIRQRNKPFFDVIKEYKSIELRTIVIAAYKEKYYNTLYQLGRSIDARGTRSYQDEIRKYDDMDAEKTNLINEFQMRYISMCLLIELKPS